MERFEIAQQALAGAAEKQVSPKVSQVAIFRTSRYHNHPNLQDMLA